MSQTTHDFFSCFGIKFSACKSIAKYEFKVPGFVKYAL